MFNYALRRGLTATIDRGSPDARVSLSGIDDVGRPFDVSLSRQEWEALVALVNKRPALILEEE